MKCPSCNAELSSTSLRFCSSCGARLPVQQPEQPPIQPQRPQWSDQPPIQPQQPQSDQPPVQPQQPQWSDQPPVQPQQPQWSDQPPVQPQQPQWSDQPPIQPHRPPKPVRNDDDPENNIGGFIDNMKDGLDKVKSHYDKRYQIPNSLVPDAIRECEEEKPIKQYNFMRMSLPIAGYRASGLLQVTNKRIIYNLRGASIMGPEYAHSELSIDDVAGISIEKSTSINIFVIIAFLLLGFPLGALGLAFGVLGGTSPILALLFAVGAAVGTVALLKSKHYVYFHLLASAGSTLCLASIATMVVPHVVKSSDEIGVYLVSVLIGLIWMFLSVMNIVSYIVNLFKNNISVVVTSKSGAAAPINCSSSDNWLIGMSLLKPLVYMYETKDTSVMEAELGAMISDIQKLGDYGLQKWSN